MAFHLYVSTGLESLGERFCREVYSRVSAKDPLKPVSVTVQTQGISTWLNQYIAGHSSIAMNLEMPFLRSSIEKSLFRFFPEAESVLSGHTVNMETWQLFHYFSSGENSIPEQLAFYFREDPDFRKRFQISRQIATVFDQYRIYRPELIRAWRNGEGDSRDWQASVYIALFRDSKTLDYYLDLFLQKSSRNELPVIGGSLSVFGISSMPPQFLYFFLALSRYQEVNFFYLSPSDAYWADADAKRKGGSGFRIDLQENPVLAAFGGQGREFFKELLRSDAWDLAQEDPAEDTGKETLLSMLQRDIRENINCDPACMPEPDSSLLIENCHTPLREIEVLHDRLLREIENGRKPGEILVTAPDIERYVPHIESVFGAGPLAGHYSVADRVLKDSGDIFPTFLKILRTPSSDYSISEIFSLLENGALQKKFHLSGEVLLQIQDWCSRSGICWGLDAETRKDFCHLKFDAFSWEQGIRRILFGYAVSADFHSQENLQDMPVDFAEGAQAENLGYFLDFLDELIRLRDLLAPGRKQTPKEWFNEMKSLPDRFFDSTDRAISAERSNLILALSELAYESESCKIPVPFPLILDLLENVTFPAKGKQFYLKGKITFCSMIPMRTIPIPVIAILGLNAGEFPRKDTVPGFNLIAKNLRPTDRSKNQEDRYLLLETLLAARDKLLIFYHGQSEKDNSELFPPPPLAELILYLERMTGQKDSGRTFLIKHHIQSSADVYFNGTNKNFYSYSLSAYQAALGRKSPAAACVPSLKSADLTLKSLSSFILPEWITMEELETFFRSPSAFYLRKISGVDFRTYEKNMPSDLELFVPDKLELAKLKKKIVEKTVGSSDLEQYSRLLQKCGDLPLGEVGKECFQGCTEELKRILAKDFLNDYTGQSSRYFEVKCHSGADSWVTFSGTFPVNSGGTGSFHFQTGKFKNKHRVKYWLIHVFLSAALDCYQTTICEFQDRRLIFHSLDREKAEQLLLRFAAMREAGAEKICLFMPGADFKPGRKKTMKSFKTFLVNLQRDLSYDREASLFFKESDFTDTLAQSVIHASDLFFEHLQETQEMEK